VRAADGVAGVDSGGHCAADGYVPSTCVETLRCGFQPGFRFSQISAGVYRRDWVAAVAARSHLKAPRRSSRSLPARRMRRVGRHPRTRVPVWLSVRLFGGGHSLRTRAIGQEYRPRQGPDRRRRRAPRPIAPGRRWAFARRERRCRCRRRLRPVAGSPRVQYSERQCDIFRHIWRHEHRVSAGGVSEVLASSARRPGLVIPTSTSWLS